MALEGVKTVNSRSSDPIGDARWELALRIAESSRFAKSARLREFLLYVCRAAVESHTEEISEQKIGERVFNRPHDYNPNEDNIVRSHARLLRQKLEAYFNEEGAEEPVLLRIPKGGYVPEFIERPAAPAAAAVPAANPTVRILAGVVIALCIAVAGLTLAIVRMKTSSTAVQATPALSALWTQLFNGNAPTVIVIPDHTFALLQEASHQRIDLTTYLRRAAPKTELQTSLPGFALRRYTTFDGVSTAIRVLQLAEKFPSKVEVRYARDISLRDISSGNVVLVGRPTTNLWGDLFESKLNFRFEPDFKGHRVIARNVSPRPGEQAEYAPALEGDRFQGYSSIAFLPNLNGGNVLMIGGAASSAQEGAGDFATDERLLSQLAGKLMQKGRLPYFDALLRTVTIDGVSQEPSIVAYRALSQ